MLDTYRFDTEGGEATGKEMIQAQGYELSEITQAVCAANILLVPLAAAGLALTNAGLGRSRSAAHALLGSLSVAGVAALAYAVCGFAWQGFAGGPERAVTLAGRPWGWIGAVPWLLGGLPAGGASGGTGRLAGNVERDALSR